MIKKYNGKFYKEVYTLIGMINVRITMVNGTSYTIRNIASNIKQFYKNVFAPFGTTIKFIELIPGEIINTDNIVSMVELTDYDISKEYEEDLEDEDFDDPATISNVPEINDDVVARTQDVPNNEGILPIINKDNK